MEEEMPIVLSRDRLVELAKPFGDLMNTMQHNGDNLAEIVTAGLYAIGVALAHMRIVIESQDTIQEGLSPLWNGYIDFIGLPVTIIPRSVN